MKERQENTATGSKACQWGFPLAVIACWLVLGLWVTGQSFWLDEGMAVSKSMKPAFGDFWKGFSATRGSDLQQPLFMLSQWVWAKVAGRSEWGLRALNGVWMAVAFGYVATRRRWSRRVRALWCLLAAVSPFVAMYMDEAKGYILHFAGGTLMFLSIAEGSGKPLEKFGFGAFSAGVLMTCGAALTGVVYAFWACLWLLVRIVREKWFKRFLAAHWAWLAVDAAGLALLGGWYLHTLMVGARGTNLGPPTPATMAFFAYEWLGFSGLGPARLVMRVGGVRAAVPYALPLALFGAANAFFAVEGWREWRSRARARAAEGGRSRGFRVPPHAVPLLLGVLGVLSMHAVGFADDMAVRARHAMPVFPAALLAVAVWADRMLASRRAAPRAAVAVLLAALATSSLALRFGDRHGKEDYRRAVSIATEALREGQCVWMSCNSLTALIYNPALEETDRFVHCSSPGIEELRDAPAPDLVLVNRPDTWDTHGTLTDYIAGRGWPLVDEFHGFRVYRPME